MQKNEAFSVQGIKLNEQQVDLHSGNNRISLSKGKFKKGMNFVNVSLPKFIKTVKCIANYKLKSNRLISLDALRGFDMLWIIGGEMVIRNLAKATTN